MGPGVMLSAESLELRFCARIMLGDTERRERKCIEVERETHHTFVGKKNLLWLGSQEMHGGWMSIWPDIEREVVLVLRTRREHVPAQGHLSRGTERDERDWCTEWAVANLRFPDDSECKSDQGEEKAAKVY